MTKNDALKLTLEAIELHLMHHEHGCTYLGPVVPVIKEALAQPERPWVGLTDEEKQTAVWTDKTFSAGAAWAEAKLKEKNT